MGEVVLHRHRDLNLIPVPMLEKVKLGVVSFAYNPSTGKMETGLLRLTGHSSLFSKL